VLKYKHLRDVVTITKIKSTCLPDVIEKCKFLVVYAKVYEGFWGQVSFGSSTKTVSSLTGCCKVTASSVVVTEKTCAQAGDLLVTGGTFTISRSKVFDTLPASVSFVSGDQAVCDPVPAGLCVAPGSDGAIICSTDIAITTFANAACTCVDTAVQCLVYLKMHNVESDFIGCHVYEPYPIERHNKSICGPSAGILPAYSVTYDDVYCYLECGEVISDRITGIVCESPPSAFCRLVNGFISKIVCENIVNTTDCTSYTSRCITLGAADTWTVTL